MQKYCIADTTFLFRGLCVIDNTNGVTGWYLPAVKEVPLCGLTSRNWEFSTSYVIPRYDTAVWSFRTVMRNPENTVCGISPFAARGWPPHRVRGDTLQTYRATRGRFVCHSTPRMWYPGISGRDGLPKEIFSGKRFIGSRCPTFSEKKPRLVARCGSSCVRPAGRSTSRSGGPRRAGCGFGHRPPSRGRAVVGSCRYHRGGRGVPCAGSATRCHARRGRLRASTHWTTRTRGHAMCRRWPATKRARRCCSRATPAAPPSREDIPVRSTLS